MAATCYSCRSAPVGARPAAGPRSRTTRTSSGQHQEPDQAQPPDHQAPARNKSVRSELRTRTKRAITAAEAGAEDSEETLRLAVKRIDKAAAKGVIHKNQAANRKSRLVRRISAIEAAAAE